MEGARIPRGALGLLLPLMQEDGCWQSSGSFFLWKFPLFQELVDRQRPGWEWQSLHPGPPCSGEANTGFATQVSHPIPLHHCWTLSCCSQIPRHRHPGSLCFVSTTVKLCLFNNPSNLHSGPHPLWPSGSSSSTEVMYSRGLWVLCSHRGTETDQAHSRPSAAGYPQDSMWVEGQGVSLQGSNSEVHLPSAVWVLWMMGGGDSATTAVVLDCNKMPEEATYEKRLIPHGDFSHLALRLCHSRKYVEVQS